MKRFFTLHLFVPAAVACFGMALIVVGYLRNKHQLSERLQNDVQNHAYREGTRLSHIAQHLLRKGMIPAADLEMSYLALSPHLWMGAICDESDKVSHASQIQWRGMPLEDTPLRDAVPRLAEVRKEMSGRLAVDDAGNILWAIFPFFEGSVDSPSAVVLAYDLVAPRREAARLALHESIAESFGLLGGSLVLWVLLDALITRRIARIVAYAGQVASGKNPDAPEKGDDEIGEVGRAFANAVEKLRRTEMQLLEAGEQERRRLGMDLHDDICQRIAAAQLKTGVLGAALGREGSPHQIFAEQVAEELSDAAEIARGCARGLAPASLDRDGLNAALRDMTGHLSKAFSVPVTYETDARVQRLPESMQVHLFRIAQELATNAAKHARATAISVRLAIQDHLLRLEVENDGRSFAADTTRSSGMGLQLVKQRVRALNGKMTFMERPQNAGGTLAWCEVPLTRELDE